MLKALAVAPTGSQEIMPIGVNVLQYYFLLIGILGAGALIIDTLAFYLLYINGQVPANYIKADRFIFAAFNGVVLILLAFNGVRVLNARSGGAAIYPLFVTIAFLGLVLFSNTASMTIMVDGIPKSSGSMSALGIVIFPTATILLGLFLLFRWREVYNWLPRRQDEGRLNIAERFLLLYTPRRNWLLALHVLSHLILWIMYFILSSFSAVTEKTWESGVFFLSCSFIPLGGVVLLARFFEKKK